MVGATRAAAHAEQHGEAVLLAVVEALVERLRRVGEFRQACGARGHGVGALAQPRDRIGTGLPRTVATAARFAAGGTLLDAIGAILGEFMSSADGLGHAIFKAGSLYIIPKVFAGVVVTIVLALFLSFLVGRLERFLMPWHKLD